jgi:hypothetical protein
MPSSPRAIHCPSRSRSEALAIHRLPITKPTEVMASCTPYSNSLAPSASMAKGSSSVLDRPKATKTMAKTRKSDLSIGVSSSTRAPSRRLRPTAAMPLCTSALSAGMRAARIISAEKA